jgi:quercetin dioxygenase-like cupin family protein
MASGVGTRTKVVVIGLGALLAPVAGAGTAAADPDNLPRAGITTIPPATPGAVTSQVLARGAADRFHVRDAQAGVRLQANAPTDVVVVSATLAPGTSTGWHRHAGPSVVVVTSGTLRMVEPGHEHGHGQRRSCSEEVFPTGSAFAHPSGTHDFANDGDQPVAFTITYLVPAGASPAPVPVDPAPTC